MSIDHVSIGVANIRRSKAFYDAVLAPIGFTPIMPVEIKGQLVGVGYGEAEHPRFWIQLPINGQPATRGNGFHMAFTAPTRAAVDAFYLAALAQGGVDDGRPALRSEYSPSYYAAFVLDPDGNKIEAVNHAPE
jgi:catechol 2,3-dioxygenase-like lactoylglutathione lyase family enzyme